MLQSYLGNFSNKTNLVKYLFQKWGETLQYVLTSSKTILLASLDGTTDRLTSQSSERIDFYWHHTEADTKMFACIKFFCDNICLNKVIIISPDTGVFVKSLYESVMNLNFLNTI